MRRSLIRFILGLCVGIAAISSHVDAREWGLVEDREWHQKAPHDFPDANAIVLFDDVLNSVDSLTWTRHVRLKVLTPAGVDEVGNVEIPYRESDNFELLEAHTIRPNGEAIEVDEDDIYTRKTDRVRYKAFAFPTVDSGCILEYRYKFWDHRYVGWYANNPVLALEASYTFVLGMGLEFSCYTRNIQPREQVPAKTVKKRLGWKTTSYKWTLRNLEPVKQEPYMACRREYLPAVVINLKKMRRRWFPVDAFDTWPELGYAVETALKDLRSKPVGFKRMVKEITKGLESRYQKSIAIYDWVTDEIETEPDNYVMTFRHKNLKGVLKEKYGSAFEKNLLLIDMMKAARVPAWPVLIATRESARLNPEQFDVAQFDHALAFIEVEQGGIYLDATSKYCPYGTVPSICHTDVGLILDSDKSELIRIITAQPESDRIDLTYLHLQPGGSAVCSTTCLCRGYKAADYGRVYDRKDPEDFVKEDVLGDAYAGCEMSDYSGELDSTGCFNVTAQFLLPRVAEDFGDHLAVNIPTAEFYRNPFDNESRRYPVDFVYPFTCHNIVYVVGDETLRPQTLPGDSSIEIDGASYRRRYVSNGPAVIVDTKVVIEKPVFAVAEYPQLREFFRQVELLNGEPVLFQAGE